MDKRLLPSFSAMVLLCLVLSEPAFCQFRLSGYIEDAQTGERLYGATVIMDGTGQGTTSNFYGFFSLPVKDPQQVIQVAFSFVGYQNRILTFMGNRDTSIIVALKPSLELEEVVVESQEDPPEVLPQVSSISIPAKQLSKLPAVAGEVDVMRAVQLLPGVQSGREGMTGIYVRGGGPDQNLILLDGVPLYSVSHLGGLFSVFNSDVISDVNLIKGGFPARYGGRLSSVLNIRTKDGNRHERYTRGAVGLISSRLTTEGPFAGGRGSYVVGGRRTYIDLFTRPISRISSGGENSFGYSFYDFNAKANYRLDPDNSLRFSFYAGDDKGLVKINESDEKGKNTFAWGNLLATARWTHLVNDRLFTNLSANYTRYRFRLLYELEDQTDDTRLRHEYYSGIHDLSLRYETEYYFGRDHELMAGVHYIHHFFEPGVTTFSREGPEGNGQSNFGSFNVMAGESSVYLEDQWHIHRLLTLNAGIHWNGYFVNNEFYHSLQPRSTLLIKTGKRSSVKLSYAAMQQNIHLLSSTGAGLPTDLWVPATDRTPPQTASQYAVSFTQSIGSGLEFSVEGYYKQMQDLITYSDGENWQDGAEDWQEKVEKEGKGLSKGLEVFVHRKQGRLNGWVGYTLSKTDRRFDNINSGNWYPYRFDRRHDVGLMLSYRINDRVEISGSWVYGTGNAITLGVAKYLAFDPYLAQYTKQLTEDGRPTLTGIKLLEHYDGRNGFRMRAYHRADLGIRFIKQKKWGERTWNIGIYNIYSRANPYYYYWGFDYTFYNDSSEGTRTLKQIALFPIIPAVSYEFKF